MLSPGAPTKRFCRAYFQILRFWAICLRKYFSHIPGKDTLKVFQNCSRKEQSLEVSGVRFWSFTPKIQKPMIGGGGPVADTAWNNKKGQPVSIGCLLFWGRYPGNCAKSFHSSHLGKNLNFLNFFTFWISKHLPPQIPASSWTLFAVAVYPETSGATINMRRW